MQSKAASVAEYLDALPDDRRAALVKLRKLVRKTAPKAVESMEYGMPTYMMGEVPLCAMASQKGYLAFYVCCAAAVEPHRAKLAKLNCGKGCIRFKSLDQLPLDVVADILKEAVKRLTASNGDTGS